MKNRKGSVIDLIVIVIIIFTTAILFIFGAKIINVINASIQSSTEMPAVTKTIVGDAKASYSNVFDGLFVFVFAGLFLAIIVGAFMIDIHPIFFVFSIILFAFIIMLGAILSNVFYDVMNTSAFGVEASSFIMTSFIMNHLLLFIVPLGFLVLIITFAKGRGLGA